MADETSAPAAHRIRASDTDRDTAAARLREALAEGRLSPGEHSERLDSVYAATTHGDLVPLTEDLPQMAGDTAGTGVAGAPRPVYGRERVGGRGTGRFSLALMGGANRTGNWVVPRFYVAIAAMGGIKLDLREARFTQREVTIFTKSVMGGIEIVVPDDIEVRVNGIGIMGGYGTEGEPSAVLEAGAPVVNVVGVALMGGVGVTYRKRQHQKRTRGDNQRELDGE